MSNTLKWIIAIVVVILVLAGIWYWQADNAFAPTETGPIKIGWIGPLSGDAASIGENVRAAVELAVEEVNQAGGIDGRQIEMIYEDGKCDPQAAATAANKLMNVDQVPIILGGACSGETSAFASSAVDAGVLVFSYCSSAPALSGTGIFRNVQSDNAQGSFAAKYVYENLDKKNVAILYVKSDWGQGIKDVFAREFEKLGGTIAIEEGYAQDTTDLRTSITKIKAAQPDAVYFLGYTEATVIGLKQMAEAGLDVTVFGGDAWDDQTIFDRAGVSAEGIMYSMPYSPLSDAFKAAMMEKTGTDAITICTPQSYDAVKILAEVIAKSGTADVDKIRKEMEKVEYTGGVSAETIAFDENGDLIEGTYAVKKVVNGVAVPVE